MLCSPLARNKSYSLLVFILFHRIVYSGLTWIWFFFNQLNRVGSLILYLLATKAFVKPFFSRASISGLYGSSLLLPGPFGRPSFMPPAFRAFRASLVWAEAKSRSISAKRAIIVRRTLPSMVKRGVTH